jgi:hypothetical protein
MVDIHNNPETIANVEANGNRVIKKIHKSELAANVLIPTKYSIVLNEMAFFIILIPMLLQTI